MRIILLTKNQRTHAGNGRYTNNLAKKLTEKGHSVLVLVEDGSGFSNEKALLPRRSWMLPFAIPAIRAELRTADVVHSHDGFPYPVIAYIAGFGLRRPKFFATGVGTYSVMPFVSSWWKGMLLRLAYTKCTRILCISAFTESRILHYMPELKNTVIIPAPIDDTFFSIPKIKKEKNTSPIIVSVGAIKPRKGQLQSVKAVHLLKKRYPNITLNIFGRGDMPNYLKEIQSYIKENTLKDNVHLFQIVSDDELIRRYKEADMFLMPSVTEGENFEGQGLVYLEANSVGTPSIGSKGTGAEQVIKDGVTGYLVEQKSPESIEKAVIAIFENPMYDAMSESAYRFAREFTWDRTVDLYVQEYTKTEQMK